MLEQSARALLTRDFESFADLFLLPQEVDTFDGRQLIETRDALETFFVELCTYYASIGLKDMVRRVITAQYVAEDTVHSTHETRLVCHNGILPRKAYPVFTVMRQIEGGWRVASGQYAIDDDAMHVKALLKRPCETSDALHGPSDLPIDISTVAEDVRALASDPLPSGQDGAVMPPDAHP